MQKSTQTLTIKLTNRIFRQMEAFYGYRLPDAGTETTVFRSCNVIDGLHKGFVVAPFRQDRHSVLSFTEGVNADVAMLDALAEAIADRDSLPESTTREQHRTEVERMISEIKAQKLNKSVAARQLAVKRDISLSETFMHLCREYPEAFIFCFGCDATGVWIGASPEILISGKNGVLTSMALAGTRSAGATGAWDEKNIREHNVVRDFIRDAFEAADLHAETGETHTAEAGPVEHLRTYITGRIPDYGEADSKTAGKLALRLSPTPALCGYPVDPAMRLIDSCEDFHRSYYGGFCGPCHNDSDFSFFVNLRSMRCVHGGCVLYAGGGINEMSDPDDEWAETEKKLSTLLRCLESG